MTERDKQDAVDFVTSLTAVFGDSSVRLAPHAKLMVNTNQSWAVSESYRSQMEVNRRIDLLKELLHESGAYQ